MTKKKAATKKETAPKPEGTCKVRLLVGRTGYGKAGDVVEYPAAQAAAHSSGKPPFNQPLVAMLEAGDDE